MVDGVSRNVSGSSQTSGSGDDVDLRMSNEVENKKNPNQNNDEREDEKEDDQEDDQNDKESKIEDGKKGKDTETSCMCMFHVFHVMIFQFYVNF